MSSCFNGGRNLQQRINIKSCAMIGKGASSYLGLFKMLSGEHAVKKSNAFEQQRRVQKREGVHDEALKIEQPRLQITNENGNGAQNVGPRIKD